MRDPLLQCKEELLFYEEIIEYILYDLKNMPTNRAIITEGAAYLPALMKKHNTLKDRYFRLYQQKSFRYLILRKENGCRKY